MNKIPKVLGIDFGETVESRNARGEKLENPRAMEVIARCVRECEGVYIISKVNPQQMVEVAEWMRDNDFFVKTGLPMENVRFCAKRGDKGRIAAELRITHMIDDRPEVMASMPPGVKQILFKPIVEDIAKWNLKHYTMVHSWDSIERIIFV